MKNSIQIEQKEFQEVDTKSVDDRQRITLGDIVKGFKRVRVYKNQRGEILLEPVVEVSASEVWLFKNKEGLLSVQKGLQDAAAGKISKLDPDDL